MNSEFRLFLLNSTNAVSWLSIWACFQLLRMLSVPCQQPKAIWRQIFWKSYVGQQYPFSCKHKACLQRNKEMDFLVKTENRNEGNYKTGIFKAFRPTGEFLGALHHSNYRTGIFKAFRSIELLNAFPHRFGC